MAKAEVIKKVTTTVADQNKKNQAARLEQKVRAHNASVKAHNASANANGMASANSNNSSSNLKNKVGSAALQAVGVPKGAANAAMDYAQSEQGQKMMKNMNKKMFGPLWGSLMNKLMESGQEKEAEDQSTVGGAGDLSVKFIKNALMFFLPALIPIVVICLFVSASQIMIKSVGLGNADNLSNEEVEEKVNKKEGSSDLNEEATEDEVSYDIFIDDEANLFRDKKLEQSNLVFIATSYLKRKYNEASLDELEDFYPSVTNISKNYDENMVYDFFFKFYNLYTNYRDKYKDEDGSQLHLDLPLIMSTLMVQSSDMNDVFESNLLPEDRMRKARKTYDEFDYKADLSWYNPTKNDAEYDLAILAQNSISKKAKEVCKDSTGKEISVNILNEDQIGNQVLTCGEGQTYSKTEYYTRDNEKYREFLKAFLSKKYLLSENNTNELIVEIYDAKEQYEDLAGEYEEKKVEIIEATSTSYWWPIGSLETVEVDGKLFATGEPSTVRITSPFGYRKDPFDPSKIVFHNAIDIAGGAQGEANIIAAKDGVVVYPTAAARTDCPYSDKQSRCGGGYGNYVIIQHSDGNYTLYAHMYANSITVVAGDSVRQGQVIGKMGSSGNSTGPHLHFEVRVGVNHKSGVVDPLTYVSVDNPRSVYKGDQFLSWLNSWEGHSPIDGDYYVVENIGDGVRTVGGGITLENHRDVFATYGINIDEYPVGSKILISIVDEIQLIDVAYRREKIEKILAEGEITLKENEIQALISQHYNTGNIKGFVDAYQTYGNTIQFYDNWFFRNIKKGTKFEKGLTRRRNSEWSLFNLGEYIYN